MKRGRGYQTLACWILAALVVFPPPLAGAASSREEATMLAAANERWAAADCRSIQEIWLKKGTDNDGSAKSRWLFWDESGGNARLRVVFEDGRAIQREYGRTVVPAGTEFTASGWKEEKSGGSLFLELLERQTGSRVKVYFWDDWVGKVGAGRVAQFERWTRLNLFEVLVAGDEVLVEDATPIAASAASPVSGPPTHEPEGGPAPMGAPGAGTAVDLRILGVSVEPLRVSPGGEVVLIVTYSVSGAAADSPLAVLERRAIVHQGSVLTILEATAARTSGTHESRQPLRIPADLAAGVYELSASVEAVGRTAEGSAIFQVTVP